MGLQEEARRADCGRRLAQEIERAKQALTQMEDVRTRLANLRAEINGDVAMGEADLPEIDAVATALRARIRDWVQTF